MNLDLLTKLQQANSDAERTWLITEAYIQNLPAELARAVYAVATPHWFNPPILEEVLQVETAVATQLYQQLQSLSFVEALDPLGHALHDLTRTAILTQRITTALDTLRQESQRVWHYLQSQPGDQNEVEAIYHALWVDAKANWYRFENAMRSYRNTDKYGNAYQLARAVRELIKLGVVDAAQESEIERQEARTWRNEVKERSKQSQLVSSLSNEDRELSTSTSPIREGERWGEIAIDYNSVRDLFWQKAEDARQNQDDARRKVYLIELGLIEEEENNFDLALERYEEALAMDPTDKWALANRADVYRQQKRYDEALADFDRAIALDEKYVWTIAMRGHTYRSMKRYEEALADFDRAIALDEKYAWAIAMRGNTYRLMKRYEEALIDFDRAIALDENNAWMIAMRGHTYRLMKRYEEALADFDRAIALDEKYTWAIRRRGDTYRLMERYEEALIDFDRAIALDENNAWTIRRRGDTYHSMERYDEALANFDRAIALDENNAWAIAMRGDTYRLMKRYEEALIDFDRAIALDEKYAWAIAMRGDTYHSMERYDEALADFDRAIALDEKYIWHRGMFLYKQNDIIGSLANFSRLAVLDPTNAMAHNNCGYLLRYLERWSEAEISHRKALEIDPDFFLSWLGLADIARRLEDEAPFQNAIEKASKILDIQDDIYDKACLHSVAGNVDKALDLLTLAKQQGSLDVDWVKLDLALHWLHHDPRFVQILSDTVIGS